MVIGLRTSRRIELLWEADMLGDVCFGLSRIHCQLRVIGGMRVWRTSSGDPPNKCKKTTEMPDTRHLRRLGCVPCARFALYIADDFLVRPPPTIPTPPYLSPNQLARNRPPRDDDAPKVPDFCPRGFRTQPHIVTLYARFRAGLPWLRTPADHPSQPVARDHAPVCAVAAPEKIARQDRPARQTVSA
jgi:hypothetical protein